jgi:hypothetical protein
VRVPPIVWAGAVTVVVVAVAIVVGILTSGRPQPSCTASPGATATPAACSTATSTP